MSEFTSTFELFTSALDTSILAPSWSSLPNVLGGTDQATDTWDQQARMDLTSPLISLPGGTPVLASITINELYIQIRWARGGNANSGGAVDLTSFDIGTGNITVPGLDQFRSTTPVEPFHTDQTGGLASVWNTDSDGIKAFIDGTNPFNFAIETTSINGSTNTKVAWVKAQIQYTYTGGGVAIPIRF